MSFSGFLVVYLLGGLTFIPLVLSIAFLHAYITLPKRDTGDRDVPHRVDKDDLAGVKSKDLGTAALALDDIALESLPEELKTRTHVPDVAAGYFAVCRDYVPGGINGKPPERTTPAGAVVASESPSVYQSMYRSIFDRNKTTSPTLDASNGKSKKARNVFYVVLRLGILMLYDDSEQLEVRHVISLAHYDVDIYGGGEKIPEGELWIKRNCIRLRQRSESQPDNTLPDAKPFFLFSDNCSEKEDFYHAILLLQSQDQQRTNAPPQPLKFHTPDLVRLVQQLHASEEYLHTRWINAIVGRIFLALYKTDEVEQYIWNKITKKIARVPKPALISKIILQRINMGTLPPFITNPKLRELTVDGDLTVEADVSYKGNFRVEISAIARIELGSRFKAREVTLVLATTLKKLEGHILLRLKPPPSNRLWITFETAPKMELSLEPIVSSRQITYGVILRAIESRLREVVSETLVLPNWDDIPFKDTELNPLRGGIWTKDAKRERNTVPLEDNIIDREVPSATSVDYSDAEVNDSDAELQSPAPTEKSIPATISSSDSAETNHSARPSAKPKAMRPGSFAGAATPVVNVNSSNISATKSELRKRQDDAASAMKTISMSQPTSPAATPVRSPVEPSSVSSPAGFEMGQDPVVPHDSHASISTKHRSSLSLPRNTFASAERRQNFNQSLNSATAAAKKWFANRQTSTSTGPASPYRRSDTFTSSQEDVTPSDSQSTLSTASGVEIHAPLGSPANPIGRGQPIPELPPQAESTKNNTSWSVPSAATIANLTRRKATPASSQPQTPTINEFQDLGGEHQAARLTHERKTSVGTAVMGVRRKSSAVPQKPIPNAPPRRPRRSVTESVGSSLGSGSGSGSGWGLGIQRTLGDDGVLVVEAPSDPSAPNSPAKIVAEGSAENIAEKRGWDSSTNKRSKSEGVT